MRTATQPGVLAHHLRVPSEHVVTVMTTVIALSPGTMVVDVDRTSSTVYVHFLFLRDLDAARASLDRLERVCERNDPAGHRPSAPWSDMIQATYVILGIAAALFMYRCAPDRRSPTVSSR